MLSKRKKWIILLIIVFLVGIVFLPFSFSKYTSTDGDIVIINARQPEYDVYFYHLSQGEYVFSGSQHFVYGSSQALTANNQTRLGYAFAGWNTSSDGTGTSYNDEENVSNLTSVDDGIVRLYAQWDQQYLLTISAGNGIQDVSQAGWTNSGTSSMSKYFLPGDEVDLSQIVLTYLTGYQGRAYEFTSGNGNISNNILTTGATDTVITVKAGSLINPNAPTISGGASKVYGYQNNNLTCATTTTYDSNVTLHYSFGFAEDVYAVPSLNSANLYDEVTINGEKFYLIERNGDTVTLITKYGINTSIDAQSETTSSSSIFTGNPYWNSGVGTTYPGSYSGSPKPYIYDSNSLLYNPVNRYAAKIATALGVEVTGKLLSYEQALAITSNSVLAINSGSYWLGSTGSSSSPYVVSTSGNIGSNYVQSGSKVRPIIIFNNTIQDALNAPPSNWEQYSTSSTYTVPMTFKGTRVYSCKVYAEDGILTSDESSSDDSTTEATYCNARINFDENTGQLHGVDHGYVEYGSSEIFESPINSVSLSYIPFGSKIGYDFNGWWTSASGGTQVIDKDRQIISNISGYTNSNGKWIITNPADNSFVNVLYAQFIEAVKTLYNVLKREADAGDYARLYSGSHQDSMDSSQSVENVYHWYGINTSDGVEILNRNNVVFADMCWQLIRTTDKGGVKLLYNGIPIITTDNDGTHYDCSTSRPGRIGDVSTSTSFSGNYVYGSGYTTSVSGNTTTYTLTGTSTISVTSSNASTTIPNIISNNPYTCRNSTGTCTTLYKVSQYSSGTSATAYTSTYRDAIGSSTFNSTATSVGSVGYMYNNRPTSSSNSMSKSATMLSTVTLSSSTLTTYQNYIFGDGYSLSGNSHILTNQTTGSQITGYPASWVGWYFCASSSSGSCTSLYYISGIDTSGTNPIMYRSTINSGQHVDSAANKYLLGDTLVDNGDGTFSLSGNVREINKKDWYSIYSSVSTSTFVCLPSYYTYNQATGENVCSDTRTTNRVDAIGYITGVSATSLTYLPLYKYGSDVQLSSGSTYTLIGDGVTSNTLHYIYNWPTSTTSNCHASGSSLSTCGYASLSKSHYTCFNLSGKCTNYYYINYTTSNYAYAVTLSGGKRVNTNVSDTNNILYSALYASNVNTTNSTIKTYVDNWYRDNLYSEYDSYIDDTIYCGDREITSFGGWNPTASTTNSYALKFRGSTSVRDFGCNNVLDRYSVSNNSAHLTYKVGLLTVAEANAFNLTTIRAAAYNYWLMTPYSLNDYRAINYYISSTGTTSVANPVSTSYSIRPVISLTSESRYTVGDGSTTNPYVVDTSGS